MLSYKFSRSLLLNLPQHVFDNFRIMLSLAKTFIAILRWTEIFGDITNVISICQCVQLYQIFGHFT